mmetsp:Transcript_106472/g.308630  ORF Transcript_106472/g.308630 Transcript_106472/m.308630 type:complete len:210 (-) Transcript_106472:1313-1942(-)
MKDEVKAHRERRHVATSELAHMQERYRIKLDIHGEEVNSLKQAAEESAHMLKLMLSTQHDEMSLEVQRYQRALAELAREYNGVRSKLLGEIDGLKLREKDNVAILTSSRYLLGMEMAQRQVEATEKTKIIYRWRTESGTLRSELMSERMHCARLELWVAAMRKDVSNFMKEIWLRERLLEHQKVRARNIHNFVKTHEYSTEKPNIAKIK